MRASAARRAQAGVLARSRTARRRCATPAAASPSSTAASPSARSAVERASSSAAVGQRAAASRRAARASAWASRTASSARASEWSRAAATSDARAASPSPVARHPGMREGWRHGLRERQCPASCRAAWKNVVVSPDPANRFLLRPRQILVAPADVADVQKHLPRSGSRTRENRTSGSCCSCSAGGERDGAGGAETRSATVRKATAGRPQGPVKVAPNHVLVGEAAVTFTGEPRIQGGNATSARPEKPPAALPPRTRRADDGKGVTIAVLDTGLFDHAWLPPALVDRAAGSRRHLGRRRRRVRRRRGRPRHVRVRRDPPGRARGARARA